MRRKSKRQSQATGKRRRISSYQYDNLVGDEIRILILTPGSGQDPLRGRMEIASLSSLPVYTAISYAWGNPRPTNTLHLPSGTLRITQSLSQALRSIRQNRHFKSLRLWADAVCINQKRADDNKELNQQLALAGKIYSAAEEIFVWLGPATPTSVLAYHTLMLFKSIENRMTTPGPDENPPIFGKRQALSIRRIDAVREHVATDPADPEKPQRCPCLEYFGEDVSLEDALWAVRTLFERRWFSRLWPIQEVARGERVGYWCGNTVVSYYTLAAAAYVYSATIDLWRTQSEEAFLAHLSTAARIMVQLKVVVGHLNSLNADPRAVPRQQLLWTLSLTSEGFNTTDPQDIVFAVRSLSYIKNYESLRPDVNIELGELWRRATVALLEGPKGSLIAQDPVSGAVALAWAAQQKGKRTPGLPTWVVDLEHLGGRGPHIFGYEPRDATSPWEGQCAGGRQHANDSCPFSVSPMEPHVLCARGVVVSAIRVILHDSARPANCENFAFDQRKNDRTRESRFRKRVERLMFVEWYFLCRDFVAKHCRPDDDVHVLMKALLVYGLRTEDVLDGVEVAEKSWLNVCQLILEQARKRRPLLPDLHGQDLVDLASEWRLVMGPAAPAGHIDINRVLALTTDGRFAWTPEDSKEADAVCLFEGAPFPFVLRRTLSGDYILVGETYVHGIAHGEAWPQDDRLVETLRIV